MQLVLSWPVRVIVIGLLIFALFVDGAGYWYRLTNHYPLAGSVPGLPPNFNGWQLYIHKGLDVQGGTHLELQIYNVPPGRNLSQIQSEEIAVIERRINALGVSEPYVAPEGNDRIVVELGGKLLTNPTIQEPILGGTAQISGSFTQQTATDLATLLNSGALPASIKVIASTDV